VLTGEALKKREKRERTVKRCRSENFDAEEAIGTEA
jgi:hypothetical protein